MEDLSKRLVEVECILKKLEPEYLKKIPNEVWNYLRINKNPNHIYQYDETKELQYQNLHIDTIAILTYINMEYLLDDEQKIKIQNLLKKDLYIAEKEKKKLFNSNNFFKNKIN